MLGFRSGNSLRLRLRLRLGLPAWRVQAHPRHAGYRRSRRPSGCRSRLLFEEMRWGLWRWTFGREIESSLVNAQVTDLSQVQAWGEHVRCHEVDIFGVVLGYLVACPRFRICCATGHEYDDSLSGLCNRWSSTRPCGLCASQGGLRYVVVGHGTIAIEVWASGWEDCVIQSSSNMLLQHDFEVRVISGQDSVIRAGLRWRSPSKQGHSVRRGVLQGLLDFCSKEVKIINYLRVPRWELRMGKEFLDISLEKTVSVKHIENDQSETIRWPNTIFVEKAHELLCNILWFFVVLV